jgi:UDP-N-acetylmuramoyl-tripeptide--D-alanyl-D-alanine ligase
MAFWTSRRVARVLGVKEVSDEVFGNVTTDTRTLEPDSLFLALAGDRFDGHDYLKEASENGAAAAVVRRGTPAIRGLAMYEVDDTLVALGLLARERRRAIDGPVVAITGTNGKTATKELVRAVLGTRWAVYATRENRNNLVGVPLTILEAPGGTDAFVIEAGASEPGEVARLRDIIEPTIAVVTNVSIGHVEGFGSVASILEEKLALTQGVPVAIVGAEPLELGARAGKNARRVVVAGTAPSADVRPDHASVPASGLGVLQVGKVRIEVPFRGRHQLENAMLAVAVARELDIPIDEAAVRMVQAQLPAGRCEVLECGDLLVMNDAYNANPASLSASLETAEAMRGGRPLVVVLGTMLELGDDSPGWHAEMAGRVLEHDPALVAVTGEFVAAFGRHQESLGDRLIQAPDPVTLGRELASRLRGGEFVLLKASRGVKLEEALPFILPESDRTCSSTS